MLIQNPESRGKGAGRALSPSKITASLRFALVLFVLTAFMAACTAAPAGDRPENQGQGASPSGRLVVYSGRSEPLIQPVLDSFREIYPEVEILLKSGSNSELANALLEEQKNPQADIFITTEVFTIQALQQAGVLQSYASGAAGEWPSQAIGPNNEWYGITQRARVIMYNTELVTEEQAPKSIFELTDPTWQGHVASANATNGSFQAQVASMRQLLGDDVTGEWLRGMVNNDVTWFGGHTDVRKAVGAGEFKLGLVNHYYYYLQRAEGSPVGIVFPDQGEGEMGLLTNLTAAGIINGSRNLPAAQALIDYLLSVDGQELFAELNYEYPLLPGTVLHPDVQPLEDYRLSQVDIAKAVQDRDATFNLIEEASIP